MNQRERIGNDEEALRSALRGYQRGIWTALPGIIEGFDAGAMTASIQPAIQVPVMEPDGQKRMTTLPLLLDVPVQFPSGGGFTLTFPVAAGDECLVIFASRHIDAWWQSGGVQAAMSPRMHDLSDGFALVGFRSVPRVVPGINASATELRTDDGSTKLTLAAGSISASAGGCSFTLDAGGLAITGGNVTHDGVNIGKAHTHGGVERGSVNTFGPV